MNGNWWSALAFSGALWLAATGVARAELRVVATIKPVHSLVAAVMRGAGTPHLLVPSGSPHAYSLKPSDATALQQAQLVFLVGPQLETFIVEPLKTLAGGAKAVALADVPGLSRLPWREGGDWEKHSHADREETAHGEHEHEGEGEGHDRDRAAAGHTDEPEEIDMHLWLDPHNARAFVTAIAETLAAADAANAGLYRANATALQAKLDGVSAEIASILAPYKARPYIVFHDAYQYLERRFALNGVGSVTVSPERQPGARHLGELREKIARLNVVCVFAEPQFEPKLVDTIIAGTKARRGVLDPIGADLAAGADLYVTLLRRNAEAFAACMR